MTKHKIIIIKIDGMRFDHRILCREADTVSLSYTTCYVRMSRH